MDIEDTKKILAILRSSYPDTFCKGINEKGAEKVMEIWAVMFSEEPYAIVEAATYACIALNDKNFAPPPGAIKQYIRKITAPQELTEQEVWNLIKKALGNSGYHAAEEYEKLPDNIKLLVGSASQLFEWSMMDSDQLNTVVSSNFMRSYRARTQSDKEYAALPEAARQMIGNAYHSMQLGDGED